MTREDAIKILEQVLTQVRASLPEHQQIQKALDTLKHLSLVPEAK